MITIKNLKEMGFILSDATLENKKLDITLVRELNYNNEYETKKISIFIHFISGNYEDLQILVEDSLMQPSSQWFSCVGVKTIEDVKTLIKFIEWR